MCARACDVMFNKHPCEQNNATRRKCCVACSDWLGVAVVLASCWVEQAPMVCIGGACVRAVVVIMRVCAFVHIYRGP